ncbi:MAG: LLM class flavin-dependent oxidoreductase [Alphaproteobacteria bacterium]|nr:LLM class flavin-dependent oxidoreductase [Alphaproteobacteria bacterium]
MKKSVSVGIHVPSVSTTGLEDGRAYAEFFQAVETLGFDAIWVEDRIFHPVPMADAVVLLSWAAAYTERVTLGTAVMVLNLRQAPVVARQVSTLQHLSGGRVTLGVSIGGRPEEYAALDVPMDRRVRVFRDGLSALQDLLTGETITRDVEAGHFFPLDNATVRPGADLPIFIGGLADAAIRRAGELGDGWIMGPFGGVEDFAKGWRIAKGGAEAAGKNPDNLIAGRLLYVAVDDDRSKARADLTKFLHGYYGPDFDVDQHAIFGPAQEVASRLREQVDAGISHLMLAVPTLDREHLSRLAHDVMPALRS